MQNKKSLANSCIAIKTSKLYTQTKDPTLDDTELMNLYFPSMQWTNSTHFLYYCNSSLNFLRSNSSRAIRNSSKFEKSSATFGT